MISMSGLNENQVKAIEWNQGPLLVLAGPGSGKTRVLTYRIARLLDETSTERFKILGITFTNKAAAEMRQRLDTLLSVGRERALLTTFHSFAAELLRQHGSHIGLKPDFAIQSQTADRLAVVSDAVKEALEVTGDQDSHEKYEPERLLKVIDGLLEKGIHPSDSLAIFEGVEGGQFLASAYARYFECLARANQQDFGTLIVNATTLLRDNPGIAKQVRRVYKHFCVDEFQDTNISQYGFLLQLLPEDSPNVFIVADDDQVIYQWNGANPKRLGEIRSRFKMAVIQLPQNYRCPRAVIDLANRLIAHNLDRAADKQQLTTSRPSETTEVVRVPEAFPNLSDEIAWVREDILSKPENERLRCVILARTKKLLEAAVQDFQQHSLPAHISVKKNEFQSAPFRWLHASFRLANARTDREQLRRVCKSFFELEGVNTRVEDVAAEAPLHAGDFLRAWFEIVSRNSALSTTSQKVLASLNVNLLERGNFAAFAQNAIEWFEHLDSQPNAIPAEAFADYKEERASWERLLEEVYAELGRTEVTLSSLLQGMDLRSKEPPAPPNAVPCHTIHTAKGMEFGHVYIIGFAEDQLPSWAAVKKGPESLEMREERRNCFVAITRTQSTLTMTYSHSYFGWQKEPSRFLREMGLIQ